MITQPIDRRNALGLLGAGAATLALPACTAAPVANAPLEPGLSPEGLLDSVAWRLLELKPEGATALGVDTGEHADLRSKLEDRSQAGMAATVALLRSDLARIDAFDPATLDADTRTGFAVVKTAYQTALDGFDQPYGDVAVGGWRNTPYAVIQNVGAYIDTPRFLDADHPIADATDAEGYIARLDQMDDQLDGELGRIRSAADYGLIPPSFLLDKAIPQMESTIADARDGGGTLVQSIVRRTGDIPGDWRKQASAIVAGRIVPALERQLAELRRQRGLATDAPGMRERPGGEAFYAWALRAATTTTMTPAQIHETGLAELERLHARMTPIFSELGYTEGSVGERMGAVAKDPRFQFAEGDAGRAQIKAFIAERLDWIRAQMPRAFRNLVSGNVEVRRLPLSEEPGAPSAYGGGGSKDGTVPGRMWINLRTTDLHRKYDLPTLVHHEAIPGHVWQGEYANRMPLIRSLLAFNPYSEGWALYSEQLADELGAYDESPVGRLGYLQNQAWRAARMVVDTGMHAQGWSRQKAIDYFQREVGLSLGEVTSEIDRYCSWPGQACGYMIGRLAINAEREKARKALGPAYDLRDFDQAVVDGGNVPMNVLSDNVARYIASTR